MTESIAKDFKGRADWVYVGRGKVEHKKTEVIKKPDTMLHEYMRQVFDVATPVALAELDDASKTQAAMAEKTARLMVPKDLVREGSGDRTSFAKKWLAWEKKASSPDAQNRLGKILTGLTYMAGSFALDRAGDTLANQLIMKKDAALTRWKGLHLSEDYSNKKMLEVGWDFLTDTGIEKFTDWSAKKLANRDNIGFVSPLSRTLGKLGSTILNVFDLIYDEKTQSIPIVNSFINPGFIEGAFRFAGAVPGMGFVRDFYAWANRQIMKGEGVVPFGTDLAYNMLIAKMIYKTPPKME